MKIPTGISAAFWFDPVEPGFQPARRARRAPQICWLDELLQGGPTSAEEPGGIIIPASADGNDRALTILLTGPPGTGKSILATELCYRWAVTQNYKALYATTEAHPPWFIENTRSLWGDKAPPRFSWGETHADITVDSFSEVIEESRLAGFPRTVRALAHMFGFSPRFTSVEAHIDRYNVVVIDSLNVIPDPDDKVALFTKFQDLVAAGPKIILCILDSPADGVSGFWEFFCDIVIRLDRTHPSTMAEGYMLRTIEIVKARYQPHAWGPHQLKIYERNETKIIGELPEDRRQRLELAHPYREDGGLFIYPSIHYLLSTYKRTQPRDLPKSAQTSIENFNRLLHGIDSESPGGIPEGRCTAFLGVRGGHKSYLGFMHVVHRVLNHDEVGLIVSLRDDVGVTIRSINRILAEWRRDPAQPHKAWMDRSDEEVWEMDLRQRLEIMYFPPGNITAEEFIHRILLSILRFKLSEHSITLLFNSLDQIEPRFPLCAKEPIFIAALLQLLSAQGITSIFVSASDNSTTHGLHSIAELILDFGQDKLRKSEWGIFGTLPDTDEPNSWLRQQHVIIRVVRHAGGHPAGGRAVLEQIESGHPLAGKYPDGLQCFVLP